MRIQTKAINARHPTANKDAAMALKSLSVLVESGEQMAVIGPSGSGKTTMLYVLACAIQPAQGQLLLGGQDPWGLSKSALQTLRGRVFLAPQMPPLPPRQRVVTAVLAGKLPQQGLMSSLRSLFYPSDIPGASEALEQFDVGDKIFDRVDRLSGGERQRVGLARALIAKPELWLIDEPLSALDPSRAEQALQTLTRAAKNTQTTMICTLHHVEMALKHFPRVLGLREGSLLFDLPAAQVSKEHLAELYAHHEDELAQPLQPIEADVMGVAKAQPAVMHCR
jgi:phosphonate transport system ATP-binding protein